MRHSVIRISWETFLGGIILFALGWSFWEFQMLAQLIGGTFGEAILEAGSPEFFAWLRRLGIVVMLQGVYRMLTFYVRSTTIVGRLAFIGDALLSVLVVPSFLWLREHIELLPVVLVSDGGRWVNSPPEDLLEILRWALLALVLLIVLGAVVAIWRQLVLSQKKRRADRTRPEG